MNVRLRKRDHMLRKLNNPSTEQQAQLNLIEISNLDLVPDVMPIPNSSRGQTQRETPQSAVPAQGFDSMPLMKKYNKSMQLRRTSVTDKTTYSFRAGRKLSSPQLSSEEVCVIKRKQALSLSNYLVLDHRNQDGPAQQHAPYKPKPSLNTRTYFKRRSRSNGEAQGQPARGSKHGSHRLEPIQESYWKIYRGLNLG